MFADYPIHDGQRHTGMDPQEGTLYPEEREVWAWIQTSDYEFADLHDGAGFSWRHPDWYCWAVPVQYLYQDYREWKSRRVGPAYDPDSAGLLRPAQFGIVLRKLLDLDPYHAPSEDVPRRTVILRRHRRTGVKKKMLALRGVKHPDAHKLRAWPGRPPHEDQRNDPNKTTPTGTSVSGSEIASTTGRVEYSSPEHAPPS